MDQAEIGGGEGVFGCVNDDNGNVGDYVCPRKTSDG